MTERRWDRCVHQRGPDVRAFVSEHLAEKNRRILLIAGAGFDPRSTVVCRLLVAAAKRDLDAIFLREERPNPQPEMLEHAEANLRELQALLPRSRIIPVQIFASDGAVVGGTEVARIIEGIELGRWTDIVVDFSALSKGVTFPAVRHLLTRSAAISPAINIHVMITDEVETDVEIHEVGSDRAEMIAGFQGSWGLSEIQERAARLWLPQLMRGQRSILQRIHAYVRPDDVCPILPFPATRPRRPDELLEEYAEELQSMWAVEPRDVIYADERNPLDLYRTILKIYDARTRVFKETGGSIIILSPLGSKVLAVGALMAALEKDFPVAYVEAIEYQVDFGAIGQTRSAGDVVHVWLQGNT